MHFSKEMKCLIHNLEVWLFRVPWNMVHSFMLLFLCGNFFFFWIRSKIFPIGNDKYERSNRFSLGFSLDLFIKNKNMVTGLLKRFGKLFRIFIFHALWLNRWKIMPSQNALFESSSNTLSDKCIFLAFCSTSYILSSFFCTSCESERHLKNDSWAGRSPLLSSWYWRYSSVPLNQGLLCFSFKDIHLLPVCMCNDCFTV